MTQSSKLHIFVLLGITALLYLPSLFGAFVYDDHYLLEQNATLHAPSGLIAAFTDDYYGQANPQYALGYYRPISLLTHWLDWQIFGAQPWGHHLTNLLLHLFCTATLYFCITALFADPQLAFLTAIFFAVHPAHAATVSFISGRVDALATFFALLGLFFFCTRRALAAPSYFVALLCKEISVTMPALAFWKEKENGMRRAFIAMIPFAVALIAVLMIRLLVLGTPKTSMLSFSFDAIRTSWRALPAYLRFLVLPPFQLYMEPSPFQMPLLWDLAATILFAAGLWFLKDRRVAGWCLVWLITLLPVIGLVRLETTLDERFLYFPSVSFCLLAAAWVLQYLKSRGETNVTNKQVIISAVIIAAIFAPSLILRQAYWHNDLALWNSAVATDPQSSKVRLRLGVALLESGDAAEAERQFREGLALPQQGTMFTAALYTHIATAQQMQGRNAEVEALYKKALSMAPDYYTAHFNLGLYYKKAGRTAEAKQQFEQALKANPRSEAALKALQSLKF